MTLVQISLLNDDFVGIAYLNNQEISVKNTIPGDQIEACSKELIKPSINRIVPECIHYNYCGGCSLQYIKEDAYLNYKNQILINIIEDFKQDINIINKPITVGKYRRRKASFKIEYNKIGYYQERTHKIFDLKECLVLQQEIINLIPIFRDFLKSSMIKLNRLDITLADNGFDLVLYKEDKFKKAEIQAINKLAKDNQINRISANIQGKLETMIYINQPYISLGNFNVTFPETSFLQASKISEQILIDLVFTNLKMCKNILDLYCGIGTYSFPLSSKSKITAIDNSLIMIDNANALSKNNNPNFVCRNLVNQPLMVNELNKFDAVVINPPREGAFKQVRYIAESKIKNIVMISCNYKTFRRDIKILINAGYHITQAQMIDQFYYSKHIEIFAVFKKLDDNDKNYKSN